MEALRSSFYWILDAISSLCSPWWFFYRLWLWPKTLILQPWAKYTAFAAFESYQRQFLRWSWNGVYITIKWDTHTARWCTGAPKAAAKSATLCFTLGWWLQARICKFVFHYHQLPDGAQTLGNDQPRNEFSSICTIDNILLIMIYW